MYIQIYLEIYVLKDVFDLLLIAILNWCTTFIFRSTKTPKKDKILKSKEKRWKSSQEKKSKHLNLSKKNSYAAKEDEEFENVEEVEEDERVDSVLEVQVKEEPYSSDDDLPLSLRAKQFAESSMDSSEYSEIKLENMKMDENVSERISDSQKLKKKKGVDCDLLKEQIKKFGADMEKKLREMIVEAQKNLSVKLPKFPREKTECPLCGEKYFEILAHLERHANRTPHSCNKCNKSFTFKGKLMDHKKFAHGINYACEICHKRFNHKDNIRIHMATHETEEKYVCYICGYSTKRKQCLEVHIMRHEDKWVCHCSICNRGFFSYATLAQHMNSHTGEKPFTCDQCGANYSNYNTLWKHSRKFHPELYNNLFSCKICGKVFMKEKSYHIHMANLHSKGNHFECDSCTKTFKKELSLIIHKRTHTNERPYVCKICGGAFTARKYLTKHMGVHKAKNYKCRFCYKKFMLEQALMNHERKHEEVRWTLLIKLVVSRIMEFDDSSEQILFIWDRKIIPSHSQKKSIILGLTYKYRLNLPLLCLVI